jgi:hypothetical protein
MDGDVLLDGSNLIEFTWMHESFIARSGRMNAIDMALHKSVARRDMAVMICTDARREPVLFVRDS